MKEDERERWIDRESKGSPLSSTILLHHHRWLFEVGRRLETGQSRTALRLPEACTWWYKRAGRRSPHKVEPGT
jgi:hypothetical protein